MQRPGALRQCLLDGSVLITVLQTIQGRYWNGDLLSIFDGSAAGIVQELDFRHEAQNAKLFGRSLQFLGYCDVPKVKRRRALLLLVVPRTSYLVPRTSSASSSASYLVLLRVASPPLTRPS